VGLVKANRASYAKRLDSLPDEEVTGPPGHRFQNSSLAQSVGEDVRCTDQR
jgi:hypothetical protein